MNIASTTTMSLNIVKECKEGTGSAEGTIFLQCKWPNLACCRTDEDTAFAIRRNTRNRRSATIPSMALAFVSFVLALVLLVPTDSLLTTAAFSRTSRYHSAYDYGMRTAIGGILNHPHQSSNAVILNNRSGRHIISDCSFSNKNNVVLRASMEDFIYSAQSTASDLTSSLSFAEAGPTSLAIIYFAGLLTSFSPCSLGLLPLTLSYISTAAGERNDKSSFFPTLAFAAGLGLVFCGFGLSASLLGGIFGQSENVIGKIILALLSSGVSLAMGLQLLDIVNIPLPSFDIGIPMLGDEQQQAVEEEEDDDMLEFDNDGNLINLTTTVSTTMVASAKANTASLFRTFLLGGSSALVASPCATPVLTSILAFVALSHNAALGATLLLTYTAGYTTPILIVGATGGEALAKAQAVSSDSKDNGSIVGIIGSLVNPVIASVLVASGTTGILTALLGNPSLAGLSRIEI